MSGARVDSDEYDKEDARDFVLWKAEREGEVGWDSPFGRGRPGWHLECSAMSMKYLGQTFDLHTGGVDNIFPHHENEIAQSGGRDRKTVRQVLDARRPSDGRRPEDGQVQGAISTRCATFWSAATRPAPLRLLLLSNPLSQPASISLSTRCPQSASEVQRVDDLLARLDREPADEGRDAAFDARSARNRTRSEMRWPMT